ncbi:Hypothetical predicted protein [Olea europaea subsp. europaea]|uniref:Uncharacterized protein n=1 Tax=Olea europaea subsp. europaea TaxID=158383 RepID=A0A8S0TZB5_OLEEU|nr:Hypothetical predicted protein [Olea europaea subsp. europaea]
MEMARTYKSLLPLLASSFQLQAIPVGLPGFGISPVGMGGSLGLRLPQNRALGNAICSAIKLHAFSRSSRLHWSLVCHSQCDELETHFVLPHPPIKQRAWSSPCGALAWNKTKRVGVFWEEKLENVLMGEPVVFDDERLKVSYETQELGFRRSIAHSKPTVNSRMAGGGNFLNRVLSYLANELIVNGLANSPKFQRFAVRTSKRIEDISNMAAQQKKDIAEQVKDASKHFESFKNQ